MALTVCVQDWVTITNGTGSQVVVMPEADYVDISDFQDVAFYVEVGANTGTAMNLDLQSSPTKDESFFGASQVTANPYLCTFSIAAGANGVQAVQAIRWSLAANQVPAKYLRWRLRFPSTANATFNFRIWAVLNQAGWRGAPTMVAGLRG